MTPVPDVSLIVRVPPAVQALSTEPPNRALQGIVLLISVIRLLPRAVETPIREVPLLLREAAQTMRGAQLPPGAVTHTPHRREARVPGEVPPILLPPAVPHRVVPTAAVAAAAVVAEVQAQAAADVQAVAADR